MTAADAAAARVAIGAGTSSFDGVFSSLSGKPTTLSGYGITDAQPLDSDLTAIAALTTTTYGRSLLTGADAAATHTTLGLGTLATQNGTFSGTSSGTNTGDQTITLTGDVTGTGTGSFAATIANNAVSFAKFVAAGSAGFVGATAAGNYSHRTPTQVTAALDAMVGDSGSGGTKGLVPAPSAGDAAASKYLKADGTWATVSGGGSPSGSSGQMQYNNAGAFGGAAQVVYSTTGTHVVVTASGATLIPLCVKGAASQSGNLQEWQNSSGTILSRISSSGDFHMNRASARAWIGDNTGGFVGVREPVTGGSYGIGYDASTDSIYLGTYAGRNLVFGTAAYSTAALATAFMLLVTGTGSPYGSTYEIGLYVGSGGARSTTNSPFPLIGTNGFGTNIPGTDFITGGGKGTGTGTPGKLIGRTSTPGVSGSSLQSHRDVYNFDGNTISGETPMLLLDCAKGTLQRVSIGASDSGGTGFKVLRVPN